MSKSKGDRRERQAQTILEAVGYNVEKPNATPYQQPQNVDFFELFDLMGIRPDRKVLFVQVKSNRASGIRSFPEKCVEQGVPFEHARVEFWICHDREGWRMMEVEEDGYETVYDERDYDKNVLHTRAENGEISQLPY